jgi:hypothetical protein
VFAVCPTDPTDPTVLGRVEPIGTQRCLLARCISLFLHHNAITDLRNIHDGRCCRRIFFSSCGRGGSGGNPAAPGSCTIGRRRRRQQCRCFCECCGCSICSICIRICRSTALAVPACGNGALLPDHGVNVDVASQAAVGVADVGGGAGVAHHVHDRDDHPSRRRHEDDGPGAGNGNDSGGAPGRPSSPLLSAQNGGGKIIIREDPAAAAAVPAAARCRRRRRWRGTGLGNLPGRRQFSPSRRRGLVGRFGAAVARRDGVDDRRGVVPMCGGGGAARVDRPGTVHGTPVVPPHVKLPPRCVRSFVFHLFLLSSRCVPFGLSRQRVISAFLPLSLTPSFLPSLFMFSFLPASAVASQS